MYRELKGIGQPEDQDTLWRYMSFEKFANILATESLFFARADKYDDKFEGYIPESIKESYESAGIHIDLNTFHTFRPYVMCNCWHHGEEESMGMWDKYHLRNSGIAIKTTMGNLKNSLPEEPPDVFIGKIEYINNHNQIKMPGDIGNLLYYPYFYKRKPFEYEQEVRAIINIVSITDIASISGDAPYEFGRPLRIDVKTLIGENSEVIVSPYADEWITSTLELIVKRYGYQFPVNPSRLLDPPT